MVLVVYSCLDCGEESSENNRGMICEFCGGRLRGEGPSISGTKDGFGISKSFKDNESGKTIDTWKKWEKAGYRNPLETTKNHFVREKTKEKIEKIKKGYCNGKR